jgi:hypothetical protein
MVTIIMGINITVTIITIITDIHIIIIIGTIIMPMAGLCITIRRIRHVRFKTVYLCADAEALTQASGSFAVGG